MAEMLIYVRDDPALEPGLPKAVLNARFLMFDIIAVNPDGFGWGDQELKNPAFRILRWPGKTVLDFAGFLGPQISLLSDIGKPGAPPLARRAAAFNLADARVKNHPAIAAWLSDGARASAKLQMPAALDASVIPGDLAITRPALPA